MFHDALVSFAERWDISMKREEAEQILAEAKCLNDGGWIQHSYNVAYLAEKIAGLCYMDANKAYCYGLLHDIGRRNGKMQSRHIIDGYKFMQSIGYYEEARICLTHTFQYKNIDAIYTADPRKDPNAQKISEITYKEILARGLAAMDSTATSFAMDNNIPIHVFGLDACENIYKVIMGAKMGTVVKGE